MQKERIMMQKVSAERIATIGRRIVESDSISEKMRLVFTLKNIGGDNAALALMGGFRDPSALLRHEVAYVLGQMRARVAIGKLSSVLENKSENAMVRHECGEALGAIGDESCLDLLDRYSRDDVEEVAETCQLAAALIRWRKRHAGEAEPANTYHTVDPAPPLLSELESVQHLESILVDETQPMFERYRAMFALRNVGTEESVLALARGFGAKSALMRHEIAYVMGQLSHLASIPSLKLVLQNPNEKDMVRHEAAEASLPTLLTSQHTHLRTHTHTHTHAHKALGAIGLPECNEFLQAYEQDRADVVRESCVVALDISEYYANDDFQYADGLVARQDNA